MLKVHSVSEEKQEKERKDGKPSRKYVTVQVADSNIFSKKGRKLYTINIFQETNRKGENSWGAASPAAYKAMEGKMIEGKLETIDVEPYTIGEGEQARTANTFTGPVLAGDTIESVAKNQGLKPLGSSIDVAEEVELAN